MTALIAARALLARIPSWAWIALAGLLLAWAAYHYAFNRGVDTERGKWQAQQVKAAAVAAKESARLQSRVTAADDEARRLAGVLATLRSKSTTDTRAHYASHPADNVACLTPSRMRAITDADNAAIAAIATP